MNQVGGAGVGKATGFPVCPVFYLRSPAAYPGRAYGPGGRTLYAHVADARYFLDHGALGRADALPGRLHDCIAILASEEARQMRDQRKARERDEWRRKQRSANED